MILYYIIPDGADNFEIIERAQLDKPPLYLNGGFVTRERAEEYLAYVKGRAAIEPEWLLPNQLRGKG